MSKQSAAMSRFIIGLVQNTKHEQDRPRQAHRTGISLPEVFAMFPDEESRPALDRVRSLARRSGLPPLRRSGSRKADPERETAPLLVRATAGVTSPSGWEPLSNAPRSRAEVGHRDLPRTDLPQGRFLHEAPSGPSGHAADRLVHASPHPGGLGAGTPAGCSKGPAEADESYFGGKVKNWPLSRRKAKGKKGTGTIGKTPVAAVLDRPTKRIRAKVLPNTQIPTVQQFVRSGLTPGATLYTDEATAYSRMPEYAHEAVKPVAGPPRHCKRSRRRISDSDGNDSARQEAHA